tara:strand:+ start:202 stop:1266 length:1065 start_codon:yes stop_codon:yes gene_type:complete
MSILRVQKIRHTASNTDVIDIANDGTCRANIVNNLSNRNLIINGAMGVAQRATTNNTAGASSTYKTLDRWMVQIQSGTITESQQDLATNDTPYSLGFRKYMRLLNQSGIGAGNAQYVQIDQRIEAQNVAQSGWNYTSNSSFVTVSFWIRASVTQSYVGVLQTADGTERHYPFEISLTADQWTKVTKTIPGDSGITVNNDTGKGLTVSFIAYYGTNYTGGSGTFNAWNTTGSGLTRWPDMTTTWATTTNATFDVTGVQLEVGSHATDMEFRTQHDELLRCFRYYYKIRANNVSYLPTTNNDGRSRIIWSFPVLMRANPSASMSNYTLSTTRDGVTGYQSSSSIDVLYDGTFSAEL